MDKFNKFMQKKFNEHKYPLNVLTPGEEYADSAIKLIKYLEDELTTHTKWVEQLQGHFVKICKIKNILEEK